MSATCKSCGNEIPATDRSKGGRPREFCSRQCANNFFNAKQKGMRRENRRKISRISVDRLHYCGSVAEQESRRKEIQKDPVLRAARNRCRIFPELRLTIEEHVRLMRKGRANLLEAPSSSLA